VERTGKASLFRVIAAAFLLAIVWLNPTAGLAAARMRVVSDIDLSAKLAGKKEVRIDADQGVVWHLTGPVQGIFGEKLLLTRGDRRVTEIEGGKFEECLEVTIDSSTFWIVSEYTGGAHCCGVYHFWGQPEPHQPIRYLGKTEGHNGGPLAIRTALVEREGALFFADLDNRFDYFHESHASSMLVNLPERYYQLSPTGIKGNNVPFQAVYLEHAQETQGEIQQSLQKRQTRPAAILKSGFGSGFASLNFSDELGQLLVKRTLYRLYARDDQTAWQTFTRDVARYYQTSRGAPELQAEIKKKLQRSPY
jgi:hypothetical protein